MQGTAPVPGALNKPLDSFLSKRFAPSASRVPPTYRETTVCYSYMCSFAYACSEKTDRPAQVLMRRCMRYLPDRLRVKPSLSGLAMDLLAKRRKAGEHLSPETTSVLDQLRPDGPLRRTV